MIKTYITTPMGIIEAAWADDADSVPSYTGPDGALAYFADYLTNSGVTGHGGMPFEMTGIEPADMMRFIPSEEWGISVDGDIELHMAEREAIAKLEEEDGLAGELVSAGVPSDAVPAIMDSISPMERIGLLRELRGAVDALKAAANPIAKIKATKAVAEVLAKLGVAGEDTPPPVEVTDDDGLSDDPNSPNYRYKDTGYIADSRKERAAQMLREARNSGRSLRATDIDWKAVETNPRQAEELIVKANLFGKTDWDALRGTGMDPGAGFLIDKVFASIGPEPVNAIPTASIKLVAKNTAAATAMLEMDRESPEAMAQTRRDYALGLETIRSRMQACKTVDDVIGALAEIKDELTGVKLDAEQSEMVADLRERLNELVKVRRDFEIAARAMSNERVELERKVQAIDLSAQGRRGKIKPLTAEQLSERRKYQDAADEAAAKLKKFREDNPQFERSYDKATGRISSPHEDREYALRDQIKAIEAAAFRFNLYNNEMARAWISLGERFLKVVSFRSPSGSTAFASHYTSAKNGYVTDWSWAEKSTTGGDRTKKPTKEGVRFQLKVADTFERVGGKAVSVGSTKQLKEMLGLRDVQSGNWVLRDPVSAKFHVEQTAAAMSDMADILGIDMQHLGLGGRLAVAFGARGRGNAGWKGAARAHYEPVHRVVNLTKMGGGGALGHELFHAIDNLMAPLTGGKDEKDGFGSTTPGILPEGPVQDAFRRLRDVLTTGTVRLTEFIKVTDKDRKTARYNIDLGMVVGIPRMIKEAGSADKALIAISEHFAGRTDKRAMKNMKQWKTLAAAYYADPGAEVVYAQSGPMVSQFMADAQFLDEGETGKYWSSIEEMAARAFQSYLEDRLADQGRRNDYLSVMADNKFHVDPIFNIQYKPYPEGEERKRINAIFDDLFKVLREQKVFENASANKELLDSIFGPLEDDSVLDSAEVIAAREALEKAATPLAKIMAGKALAEAIAKDREASALQPPSDGATISGNGNGAGTKSADMNEKLTKIQREALMAAADHGDPYAYVGEDGKVRSRVATTSYSLMIERLHKSGLLRAWRITEAGLAAIGRTAPASAPEPEPAASLPTDIPRLTQAISLYEAGFTSESEKKGAMALVSGVFETYTRGFQDRVLAIENDARTAEQNEVYWNLPSITNWRQKHANMVLRVFPDAAGDVAAMGALVELRQKMKDAPVNKPLPKAVREQQRLESARGSMDPTINDIVAKLEALKPVVAEEFREEVTRRAENLVGLIQSGKDVKTYLKTRPEEAGMQAFLLGESQNGALHVKGVDAAKIEKESVHYADDQIQRLISKLLYKIGNLSNVALERMNPHSLEFVLTGDLGGKKVRIRQSRIINSSASGTLFHQWPALIYVDGELVSESQYKGLGGITEEEKPQIKVGSTVKVAGQIVKVVEIRDAAARGIGPAINGRVVPHVFWKSESGELKGYPLSRAKLVG